MAIATTDATFDPDRTITAPQLISSDTTRTASSEKPSRPARSARAPTYADLPLPLRPSTSTRLIRERVEEVAPFARLPTSLVPRRLPLPPTLLYGYPITNAQIEKFFHTAHPENNIVPFLSGYATCSAVLVIGGYFSEYIGYTVDLVNTIHPNVEFVISLGDNYTLSRISMRNKPPPGDEATEKLREALEIEVGQRPKWYIDYIDFRWRS